ncbi:MAG TPA: sn-glycerol-3-phosphate ABC transporter ATP-binding protein UgpC [Phycisphaerae bacterium]|nr:sn-glycerol-3-phosphate ABC transporter ATP-binding protein UgpC [Phycisphaerae bacterium]HNU45950.1 sn-glycerol-3-phosphate ABC transporter ATP-binding protein UgpC [Phycisphaerae bacterium]
MAAVSLEGVTKLYRARRGDILALQDFTLDIADAEFVVLVGPSGCGKSTTLRIIAGLEKPTAGTVRIGDCVVNTVAPKDRDVAMVFQNYALYPHMTVYKNMAFGLKMRKVPRAEIERKVMAAAGMLGIEHLLDRKPAALSGGERQRVAVGRAIVRNPRAFLFDEPLSNLDAKLRVQMRAELKRLHRQLHTTSVYVTHDQEEAMTLGDRIVVMKDGLIQQCDTPLTVYAQPANRFVAGFVGMPPMNFMDARIEADGGEVTAVVEGHRLPCTAPTAQRLAQHASQTVVVGARPESLLVQPADATRTRSGDETLLAEVQVVEPLGERQDVYLRTAAGTRLIARVPPTAHISPGDNVTVAFDPDRLHLFEADATGQRII